MHWILLTAIGALANAAFVLLWKYYSPRADIMALMAFNNIISGVVVLGYMVGVQKMKLVLEADFIIGAMAMAVCSGLILIFFSLAVKTGPVSYVNPIFSGILNTGVVVFGILIFAEKISLLSGAGILAVLAGSTMIALG